MPASLYSRDLVSIRDLNKAQILQILAVASRLKKKPEPNLLAGKLIASCFFEASTRTRLSFETAVQRLGGQLIGFADAANTSGKKGETLSDSIRMISSYADAIIMRHPREGSARLAAELAKVPVINGGDGANQHPTQTLLDLFSIFECRGRLDGVKVAFVGDLKYGRTVHSLAQALALFNGELFFVSPKVLGMPDYLLDELTEAGVRWQVLDSLEQAVEVSDFIYMTRVQKERLDPTEYMHIASQYILGPKQLEQAKPELRILHPLPRIDEISPEVDAMPQAYYFQQAENGVYARQALLSLILNPNELQETMA